MKGPSLSLAGVSASEDLSAAQYHFVKVSGDLTVELCDTAGEVSVGVLANKPISGGAATVQSVGQVEVEASAAIVATEQASEASTDREAETGATKSARNRAVRLDEGIEDGFE